MRKYNYKTIDANRAEPISEELLNNMGDNGWDLVSTSVIFSREYQSYMIRYYFRGDAKDASN